MEQHNGLNIAIHALAERLDRDEITFAEVLTALAPRLKSVSGTPHMDPDQNTEQALAALAVTINRAIQRQTPDVMVTALHNLGYGVATGVFGVDFFDKIRAK